MTKNILTLSQIEKIAKKAHARGKTIVTTNGAFDLLHIGHVRNLTKAKSFGDILIVGVNSDRSVRTHKDKFRPIVPERDRAEVVAALKAVDYVFIFNDPNPIPWITKIKPDFHAKGADRTMNQIVEKSAVEKNGGMIVRLPLAKGRSTTAIIEKIQRIPRLEKKKR